MNLLVHAHQHTVSGCARGLALGRQARSVGRFFDVSSSKADRLRGASHGTGCGSRAHRKGVCIGVRHAFSFAPWQLVIQQVIPSYFFMEAPMEQIPLRLLCRLDAPAVVPPAEIAKCKTYRDAVKLCWRLRRVRNMTQRQLAEEAGLYAPHVSCYLHDTDRSRDLPGSAVRAFEMACGNTAISQWHSLQAQLTVVEEMQAMRLEAA
jgi:hypothetical protein